MAVIGVVDMIALVVGMNMPAYFSIRGISYCDAPIVMTFAGLLAQGGTV